MRKTKIDTKDLMIGMYVAKLDRSWLETPFLFQGFRIETEKQLERVRNICNYVYIDEEKSDKEVLSSYNAKPAPVDMGPRLSFKTVSILKQPQSQPYTESFEDEFPVAREIYDRSSVKLAQILEDFRFSKDIETKEIVSVVHGAIDSVMRNPDALLLLSNMKSKSQDTVRHSINVNILSLVFGRHLGFNSKQLAELGIAALLHDVGETRVPKEILDKHNRGLTPEERKVMEMHAQYGAEILRGNPSIPAVAVDVAYSHHERINGKGYPRGLKGSDLSLFSKLVAIVDVYETVTNNPGSRIQVSSADALRSLYSMRESFFDGELVEQFIKCLGIYPIGSVVELNSGEIGIVISLKPGKQLLPTLMIVRDKEGKPCTPPYVMNLDSFKTEEGKPVYFVTEVLEPNAFGIDLSDFIVREIGFRAS